MKKILYLIGIVLITTVNSYSQNLVNNPSFEEIKSCPEYWFDFSTVIDCFVVHPSPDIFNICYNDSSFTGVPYNFFGNQHPRTGNSYIGLGFGTFYINPNDSIIIDSTYELSEVVGLTLKSSLLSDVKYCVNFYVSLGNRRTC